MPELRTTLPDARVTPRFAGLCTFCRFPRLEDVPAAAAPVDWILMGVPFDAGVTYRPGARFGPRAIRDASQYVKPYSIEHDVNICQHLGLCDGGDAPISPYSLKGTLDAVRAHALSYADHPAAGPRARTFAVGGDHSIAYANMHAAWSRQGRPAGGLALLHFDSHLDTVDAVAGEKWTHASPFIRAIEDGIINPRKMLSIGVKGPLNSASDLDYARRQGITVITCEQQRREGFTRIDAFRRELADEPAYLTFDIDCVDPAFAPGTGTPSVGGFSSAEVLALLRRLSGEPGGEPWVSGGAGGAGGAGAASAGAAGVGEGDAGRRGLNLVGADVVEVLPDRDVAGITAFLAAHIIFEILCLDAVYRRAKAAPGGAVS